MTSALVHLILQGSKLKESCKRIPDKLHILHSYLSNITV